MICKNIPGTDLNPSSICLGAVLIGSSIDTKNSFLMLDSFVESAGNFIDTAHIYSNWIKGESLSEKTIGKWIKERGNRKELIIGTKGGIRDGVIRLSRDEIIRDLNESLEYLGTGYIDLYWLHRDDPNRPVADIIETLNELEGKGKIRYFGCCNWKIERIREAMVYASDNKLKCFVGNQVMWSLAVPNTNAIEDKTFVMMNKNGIGFHKKTLLAVMPYSSQAQGFFTKMHKGIPLSDHIRKLYYSKENIKRFERVKKLAHDLSRSVTEISLGYLMSQPFTTIPIIGCRTLEQLAESLKAGDLALKPDMVKYLEEGKQYAISSIYQSRSS